MRRQRPVFSLHPCASAQFSDIANFYIYTACCRAAQSDIERREDSCPDHRRLHTRVCARARTRTRLVAIRDASGGGYCSITRNKKRKNKAHRGALVGGETARINEFRRGSDRYRRDRKIQLFSFYFFTTQERFLTSVLIRGIKAITHVVSRLRASERANQRTNARTGTLGLT